MKTHKFEKIGQSVSELFIKAFGTAGIREKALNGFRACYVFADEFFLATEKGTAASNRIISTHVRK